MRASYIDFAYEYHQILCNLSLEKLGFGIVSIAGFNFFESSGSAIVITVQILGSALREQVAHNLILGDIFRADFVNIELVGIGDLFINFRASFRDE